MIELLRTKGGKARSVPIHKDLKKALRDYRADCKRTNDKDLLFRARQGSTTSTGTHKRGYSMKWGCTFRGRYRRPRTGERRHGALSVPAQPEKEPK